MISSMFKENKNIINKNSLLESESILENNSGLSSNSLEVHSQSMENSIEALSDINKRLASYLKCNYNK